MTWTWRRSVTAAAVLCAIVLAAVMLSGGNDDPASTSPLRGARTARAADVEVTDLKLELLDAGHGEPTPPERDPFRFQARPVAPPASALPRAAAAPAAPVIAAPPVPAGPAPPAPIPLKFIGLVEAPTQGGRVAILSDGRGNVLYGKEGDTIEGRYRLLSVATDAVELAYVDGKGRQTLRLAGQ